MRPLGTRVWHRNHHKAFRGVPTGRRATHPVETTYGHRQRERDRGTEWVSVFAARRAELAEREAARQDGTEDEGARAA